jgi:hypothetical protein
MVAAIGNGTLRLLFGGMLAHAPFKPTNLSASRLRQLARKAF